MNLVKVSAKVALNPWNIIGVSDTIRLNKDLVLNAIDLSGGSKRTAVFMDSGAVFLIELKVETFLRRLEHATELTSKK